MAGERVLLVDDEELFVTALAQRMRKRGLEVDTAGDGEVALEIARHKTFDAIVLDLAMPKMDGLTTLQKLLEIDADLQIILLTGHGNVAKGVEAMKLGAVDFLEKPADLPDLLEKIDKAAAAKAALVERQAERDVDAILKSKGW
jgi:DNA-binding NtrC family response regulator